MFRLIAYETRLYTIVLILYYKWDHLFVIDNKHNRIL